MSTMNTMTANDAEIDAFWNCNRKEYSGKNLAQALKHLNQEFRADPGGRYQFKLSVYKEEHASVPAAQAAIRKQFSGCLSGTVGANYTAPKGKAVIIVTEVNNDVEKDGFEDTPKNPLDAEPIYKLLGKLHKPLGSWYIKNFKKHLAVLIEPESEIKKKVLAAFLAATKGSKPEAKALMVSGSAIIQYRDPVMDFVLWDFMRRTKILAQREFLDGTIDNQEDIQYFNRNWFIVKADSPHTESDPHTVESDIDPSTHEEDFSPENTVQVQLRSGDFKTPAIGVNPNETIPIGRCGPLEPTLRGVLHKLNRSDAWSRKPDGCPSVYFKPTGVVIARDPKASVRQISDGSVLQPGQHIPYPAHLRVGGIELTITSA